MNLKYMPVRWHIHISVNSVLYASAIHKHTHTRILKPFEDSEPTGLKAETLLPSKVSESSLTMEVVEALSHTQVIQ